MVTISKSFLKSSAMYTLAGSLPMASAIILLPFYLLYLSTEMYGALAIYLALAVLVQILTAYSFDTGVYVFFHEYKKDAEKLKRYVSSVFQFVLMVGAIVGIIFLVLGDFLFDAFFAEKGLNFFPFGIMAVATGVLQSLFKVHSSLLQTAERPGLFFWANLLSFSLIAGFTIIGLELYPQTLWGPIGGRLAAAVLSAIWVLARVYWRFGILFDFTLLKESFPFNHPSLIYQLQQWSMNYFDRFIMVFFLPLPTIGVYDFAIKCMLAVEFVISGLYNSFYPKVIGIVMAQDEKNSTPEVNRYYHGLIACIMVLVCLAILGFSVVIDLGIIKSGYEDSIHYLPLIGIVYLVRAIRYYFAMPYGALKYSKPLPLIYLFVSVLKIALIVVFIGNYGVYAVIGAAVVSTVFEISMLWQAIGERFRFRFNKLKIFAAPLLLAVCIGLIHGLNLFESYIAYVFYLITCFLVLAVLYRKELRTIMDGKLLR